MKKTVQIVTIPLGESSKLAKKDTSDKYELAEGETVFVNGIGYTPQQLLVLSDDEIQKGDWCTMLDSFGNVMLGLPQQYNPSYGDVGYFKPITEYRDVVDYIRSRFYDIDNLIAKGEAVVCQTK